MHPAQHYSQSFLIISLNKNLADIHTLKLINEREVNPLDVNLHTYEKAMGIGDVRNIQKNILLKPLCGKTKAIILDAYENITLEAQSALLKILEEPPANTIIVVKSSRKELVLPTIISRCKVIILQEKEIELSEDDVAKHQDYLNSLLNDSIAGKIKAAETIASSKENAILWLEKMIALTRGKLIEENGNCKYLNLLKNFQETYKTVKSTNVSPRIILENLFLSF